MSDKLIFSKHLRLLKKKQFEETLAKKPCVLGKYYVFYYRFNGLTHPRLGVIAPKKKCHLAVLRNKIKRQARESFRHIRLRLPAYDVVAIARQQAQEASQCELRQCLDHLFLELINQPKI